MRIKHTIKQLAAGISLWVSLVLWPQIAQANGEIIVASGDKGPFNVTLFASPGPPSTEVPVHFTLVLTKASSDKPINTATVIASPSMPGRAMPGSSPARFIQTPSRPNQYDADVAVSKEGIWNVNIQIADPQLGQTSFEVTLKVEKPSAPWGIIIAILIALLLLAGLIWWLLFRNSGKLEDDEE